MKKKVLILVFLALPILLLVFSLYAKDRVVQQQVSRAMKDLRTNDVLIIREAIKILGELSDSPNIGAAVHPLQDILEDPDERFDRYTRSLAAESLAKIARGYGSPRGDRILKPVVRLMVRGKNDFIRAGCISALGSSGLDSMILPLEDVYLDDPSPYLRDVAYYSLSRLTNGEYFSGQSSSLTGSSSSSSDSDASPQSMKAFLKGNCLTEDEYKWIKKNFIILNPEYDLDSLLCDAKEEE